ncbi:MAG TPA: carbon-nitrogen family hydrolase [Anaerolineaceae bacterium]|nr:carbon-nitrogen family hydrolase [Anaerolineaceae bacterium]
MIIIQIMPIPISLAQIHIQLAQPNENLENGMAAVEEAARRNSALVLLPELWTTGYDLSNARRYLSANREALVTLKALAVRHKISIGGSMLLDGADGDIYNTFVLLSPDQDEPVTYRKTHLFRLMDEEKWLRPGERLVRCSTPWGEAGLAVCYDLRFPEQFRRYALEGARLVLLVSEWPLRRVDHWKTLLRARAIENQMFFAAVNAVGETGGETFAGASAVLSPWGETLAEGNTQDECLLTAEIDPTQVDEVRRHIPVFQDRRPDLYG